MAALSPLSEIVGRRIIAVVTSKNKKPPPFQVFLVFDDGKYFELYGDEITSCKGIDSGGLESALNYARKFGGKLTVYPETLDSKVGQSGQ